MSRRIPWLFALGAALVTGPGWAAPTLLEPPAGEREAGLVWSPMAVRITPLHTVQPDPPYVPASAPAVSGEVTLEPGQSAAMWLDRLDVVRIRLDGPGPAPTLRATRVVGDVSARAEVDESEALLPVDGRSWLVVQGPVGGAVWHLSADAAVDLHIERLARRPARVIWETTRRDLLDRAAGADVLLPGVAGATGMQRALDEARAVAERVGAPGGDDPVSEALAAWTAAVALELWAGEAPFDGDVWALDDPLADAPETTLDLPETAAGAFSAWVELPDGAERALTLDPGVLRVEARALDPGRSAPVVRLTVGGRDRVRLDPRSLPARLDRTPMAAFPDRQPLTTADGRPVGPKASAVWPVAGVGGAGQLTVRGGPALVRLTHGRVRPLLDEALGAPVSVAERLAFARRRLKGLTDPAAERARVLVAGLADPTAACDVAVDDPVIAAWAALRCLTVDLSPARFDALPAVLDAAQAADVAVTWGLRLDAADRAQAAGRPDASVLLPEAGPSLPPALAGEVARRRPRPPVDAVGAGATVAEEAWRRAPTDRDARAQVLRTWARTIWSAVRPEAPPPPRRWLATGLDPRPDEDALSRLSPFTAGQPAIVSVPPPPPGLGRSTRMRMVAMRPGGGPFGLAVGEQRFRVEAGAPVEELAFAAAPGDHRVMLDADAGDVTLWLESHPAADEGPSGDSAPNDSAPGDSGRIEWAWSAATPDGPLRFAFPISAERRRMKLALRGLGPFDDGPLEIRLTIKTDIGPYQAVDLRFAEPDPDAHPVDDGPLVSRPVDVVIDLPPTTGAITLQSARGDRLLVRPTLRTPALIEPMLPKRPVADPEGGRQAEPAPMAVVEATSVILAHHPSDWRARIRRAHALLDLDLTRTARADIERLRFDAPPEMAALVDGLLARYGAARDPDVLPMPVPAGARVVPLDGLLVPAGTPADAPAARLARQGRAQRAAGASTAAARTHLALYRETGTVAAAREALTDLRAVVRQPSEKGEPLPIEPGLPALAFGAVARMDDDGQLTGISGLRGPASARSRWLTVEAMQAAAGYETLRLPAISPDALPSVRVGRALLAAPWPPEDGHRLTPGRGATISLRLTRPVELAAEVWCAPDAQDRPCRLRIRDGAAEPERRRVPAGQKTAVALGAKRGRVAIELVLEDGGAEAAGLRFVADRAIDDETAVGGGGQHVIRPFRERRVFRALHGRPVEIVAEGPGAVRIESWRPLSSDARAIAVLITAPDGTERRQSLALDPGGAWARGEGRRPLKVSQTRRLIIPLLGDGAHRVRVEPDAGEGLLRLSVRVDRPGRGWEPPPPMAWRLVPFDPTGLSTALAPPEAKDAAHPGEWGTLTFQLSWLQAVDDEALGDSEDADDGEPPTIGELAVIGRRRFDEALGAERAYVRLSPALRADLDGALVLGGRGALRLDGLPGGLGLELAGEGWTAPEDGAWSARGRLTGWRSFRLAPDWLLTPSARLWAGRFADPVSDRRLDPVLGTDWRRDHSRGWRLGGSLRWQMLRAQHLRGRVDAYSNDDFASLDRVDPSLSWTALFGLGPLSTMQAYLGYRPSIRFADDDRRAGGVTHQASVGLDAGFWLSGSTRLVLGGRFRPFIGLGGDLSPRFVLTAAIDLTGGRALTDFTAIEEPYPDLAGRRFWLPPREVDR